MTDCGLETSVPDWLIDHPETRPVFLQFGLDESCAGKSLEYVCHERGVDPHEVMVALRRRLASHEM